VDLTDESVYATKLHLKSLGLSGNVLKGNAEDLLFNDSTFDIVYSHGVLHHTADIKKALREIHRV
jgi:ubiquinone/menaquinone biosynthesis C-methylase UbiE